MSEKEETERKWILLTLSRNDHFQRCRPEYCCLYRLWRCWYIFFPPSPSPSFPAFLFPFPSPTPSSGTCYVAFVSNDTLLHILQILPNGTFTTNTYGSIFEVSDFRVSQKGNAYVTGSINRDDSKTPFFLVVFANGTESWEGSSHVKYLTFIDKR